VAEAAIAYGVEKFVLVSTDKAVNPANVMGGEQVRHELAARAPEYTPRASSEPWERACSRMIGSTVSGVLIVVKIWRFESGGFSYSVFFD